MPRLAAEAHADYTVTMPLARADGSDLANAALGRASVSWSERSAQVNHTLCVTCIRHRHPIPEINRLQRSCAMKGYFRICRPEQTPI